MRNTGSFVHPETRTGEVFLTNINTKDFQSLKWRSKRLGAVVYDGKGNRLWATDWFPAFISRAELKKKAKSLREARSEVNHR